MTTETTYIACDGRRFTDEWECEEYEFSLQLKEFQDDILLFNGRGEKLPLNDEGLSNLVFLKCKTKESAQFLFSKVDGIYWPWESEEDTEAGCWYYNFEVDSWCSVGEYLKKAKIMENIMAM